MGKLVQDLAVPELLKMAQLWVGKSKVRGKNWKPPEGVTEIEGLDDPASPWAAWNFNGHHWRIEGQWRPSILPDEIEGDLGTCKVLLDHDVVLDMTIANVSVPHIAGGLGISSTEGTWVITSYAVAEAICVPLTGWLARRFGEVRVFVAGMIGFGVFSFLCGVAPNLGALVVFRIGQGLGKLINLQIFEVGLRHF